MTELSKFLNDLIDTRKCVITQSVHYNMFDSVHFLHFIDSECARGNILEILRDE